MELKIPEWLALALGVGISATWVAVMVIAAFPNTGVKMPPELQFLGMSVTGALLVGLIGRTSRKSKGGDEE